MGAAGTTRPTLFRGYAGLFAGTSLNSHDGIEQGDNSTDGGAKPASQVQRPLARHHPSMRLSARRTSRVTQHSRLQRQQKCSTSASDVSNIEKIKSNETGRQTKEIL